MRQYLAVLRLFHDSCAAAIAPVHLFCRRGAAALCGLALMACSVPDARMPTIVIDAPHNTGAALAIDESIGLIASGGAEGHIALHRLRDGSLYRQWQAHPDGGVTGIESLGAGRGWLSAGYRGELSVWTRDGRLQERHWTVSPITDLALDVRHQRIATGHLDGMVREWRLPDLRLIASHPWHRGAVHAVALHPVRRQLASSGSDGHVWWAAVGTVPRRLVDPASDTYDLTFSPDGRQLSGAAWFQLVHWNLDKPAHAPRQLRTAHHGQITALRYTPDGAGLWTISRHLDSAVLLLDAHSGATREQRELHELCGKAVTLSESGRYLASSSDDAHIHIWDLHRSRTARQTR